jgi:hypothetical protein
LSLLLYSSILAVVVQDGYAGTGRPEKHWAITTDLRMGYDDNIFSEPLQPQESVVSEVDLMGTYSYPTDSSDVRLSVGGGEQRYFDRPGEKADYHAISFLSIKHTLTPRWSVSLRDQLRFEQEAPLDESNFVPRRLGDHFENVFSAGTEYQITKRLSVGLQGVHEIIAYTDEQRARDLDRQTFGVAPHLSYRVREPSTLKATYQYERVEFDESPRDADVHKCGLGWAETFSPRWSGSVEVGGEFRLEDSPFSNKTIPSPYGQVNSSHLLSRNAQLTGGIRYGLQETDANAFLVSRTLAGFFRFSWKLSKYLSWGSGLDVARNELEDELVTGTRSLNEMSYRISESLSYNFYENLYLNLTYTFTTFDSEDVLRRYDRNIMMVGISVVF